MEENGNGSQNDILNAQFGEQVDDGNLEAAFDEQAEIAEKEEVVEEKVEKPENDEFSKKFAALSREEKNLRSEREQFRAEMEEFKRMKEEQEAQKEPEIEELPLEYRLRKDPLNTLKELGLDYETLTELALNDGKLSNEMQMKLMKEEMEKELENKYKYLEDKITNKEKAEEEAKYQQVIENFKFDIADVVKSDTDAYELINANNANDLVYDVIEEHHKETGNVLEIKEAAEAVEAYLLEEAQKFLKLKKLTGGKEPSSELKPEVRQSSTTLSNDHSAQSVNESDRKLTEEESLAKAASMLKWD